MTNALSDALRRSRPLFRGFAIACLAACAGSTQARQAPDSPREHAHTDPQLSSYQQRWSSACGDHATVGDLPAPMRHRYNVVVPANPAPGTPFLSSSFQVEPAAVQRLNAALSPKVDALRACFANVEHDAAVELAVQGLAPSKTDLAPQVVACVAAVVRTAVSGVDLADAEWLAVVFDHPVPDHPVEGLPKQHIRDVIRGHMGDVRRCYEDALAFWPKLAGKVEVRFIIAPEGNVAIAQQHTTTFNNPWLECCVTTAVKSWSFQRPGGGGIVVVTYPFVLEQVP